MEPPKELELRLDNYNSRVGLRVQHNFSDPGHPATDPTVYVWVWDERKDTVISFGLNEDQSAELIQQLFNIYNWNKGES